MIKIGSLFSGIGGFEKGIEDAFGGMAKTVWQVEQNSFCQRVLKKHWPNATIFDDVRTAGKHNLEPVHILCGGWPCQSISTAGGKCIELLATYNPESQSWKMLQMSFDWADPMLLAALPQSGMTVNGKLYELHILEHHTTEPAGFVLPTPTATEQKYRLKGNSQSSNNLEARARKRLLPTPTVNEAKNNPSTPSQWTRNSLNADAARLTGLDCTTGKGFQLNPPFVEEMMGYPIGWTE